MSRLLLLYIFWAMTCDSNICLHFNPQIEVSWQPADLNKTARCSHLRMQRARAINKHTCINTVSAHSRQDVGHVWPKAVLEGLMRSFVLGTDSLVMFHPPFPWDRLTKQWDSERQDRQRGSVPWRLSAARKIPDPLWALYPCRACNSVHTSWATINLAEAAWQCFVETANTPDDCKLW